MRQEVNLYGIEFHRQDQLFSVRQMLWLAAGFFALLMVVEMVVAWQWQNQQAQLAEVEGQRQAAEQQLEQARAAQPQDNRNQLEDRLAQLQEQIAQRRQLLKLIGGQEFGNIQGFSGYLQAMARQAGDNTALTEFRLLDGGSYLELEGWTRQASAVPGYLHKLRSEPLFKPVRFGVLSIDQEASGDRQLRFSLTRGEVEP